MIRTCYADIAPYQTRDGSQIRELMHPSVHHNRSQSLAEATVAPGRRTIHHKHVLSEELYHVTAGEGRIHLGSDSFVVHAGDTICIPAGTPHSIVNTGSLPLVFLCCCSPPYAHEDTILLESERG